MADASTSNGFVETEIGLLPSDWQVCKLGDCCTLATGGTPSRAVAEYWNGGIPWVKTGEITYTTITETEEFISQQGLDNSAAKIYPTGTLLVAMYGQGVTRGRAGILGIDAAINQACAAITVSEKIRSDFLFYALKAHYERIRELGHGANQRNLNMQLLRGVEVPVPPIEEQRAIAGVLRTVQRAKEATETVIAAVGQLKQSLMRHLFTYGPVPFQQADHVELQETRFGDAPANWETQLLDDCCVVQTGVAKGRKFGDDETVDLPYLRVANVQGGYLDLSEIKQITIRKREIDRYSLQDGDVVLTEGGDFDKLGRGFIWRNEIPGCLHQNHVFAVRADRRRLMPEFVAHQTQSDYGRAYFLSVAHRTTNLACINTTKLKAFPMLIPPLPVQQEITATLEVIDRKLAEEDKKGQAMARLFDSLLHDLMTGQRRVHELGLEFTVEETA